MLASARSAGDASPHALPDRLGPELAPILNEKRYLMVVAQVQVLTAHMMAAPAMIRWHYP